jgi:hypothetical protein
VDNLIQYFDQPGPGDQKSLDRKYLKKKKGLLSSATFQVNFHAVQFICCDLQMIYDQSFCYLCVGAGNLYGYLANHCLCF